MSESIVLPENQITDEALMALYDELSEEGQKIMLLALRHFLQCPPQEVGEVAAINVGTQEDKS